MGIDDAMVLPQQFLAGKLGNLAKLIVDISDAAPRISDGNNGVGVQRRLKILEFLHGYHRGVGAVRHGGVLDDLGASAPSGPLGRICTPRIGIVIHYRQYTRSRHETRQIDPGWRTRSPRRL